jgi:hypothetical protein
MYAAVTGWALERDNRARAKMCARVCLGVERIVPTVSGGYGRGMWALCG